MCNFDELLQQIISDKQSGSVAILQQLLQAIKACLKDETDNRTGSRDIIQDHLPQMHRTLGHFAVVSHFLGELEKTLKEHKSRTKLLHQIDAYNLRWKNTKDEVAQMASAVLPFSGKTFLVHSNSSTIISFFQKIGSQNNDISILQTEARPENEGRYQAIKLANFGFKVNYVVDAAAALVMDKADLMITGADQINQNYFVNKIGTYALALLCREKQIPVYVLADSRKISNSKTDSRSLQNIDRPGADIWDICHENIKPVNYYFEAIPLSLVKKFITEKSALLPREL
jgi:translation initiation factor 2B subunit (eIF-2B alpha/beta/delta family)